MLWSITFSLLLFFLIYFLILFLNAKFQYLKTIFPKIKNGEKLQLEMSQFMLQQSFFLTENKSKNLEDHKIYKNFHVMYGEIIRIYNAYGELPIKTLMSLRNQLQFDLNFEKKFQSTHYQSLAQFLLLSFITWAFVMAQKMNGVSIEQKDFIWLLLVQLSGLVVFYLAYIKFHRAHFKDLNLSLQRVTHFNMLFNLELPLQHQLESSKVFDLEALKKGSKASAIVNSLFMIIQKNKQLGVDIGDELNFLVTEIISRLEKAYSDFHRTIEVLKYFIIFLFFLPSFLWVNYLSMSGLLDKWQ